MAKKSFRLRIFRSISNIHICCSDDSTAVLQKPTPPHHRFSPVNSEIKGFVPGRRVSSAGFITFGCVAGSPRGRPSGEGAGGSSQKMTRDDGSPLAMESRKKGQRRKRRTNKARVSASSADSGRFFSSDGDADGEETEKLFSSFRSFSTECSSEYWSIYPLYAPMATNRRKKNNYRAKERLLSPVRQSVGESEASPVRLSVFFRRLMPCPVEGKVRESFAVVKRSKSPYEDFKSSMMDMVVEKQIIEEQDLEQLLLCFLSLNTSDYHALIVHAFVEIWEALFRRS